MLATHCNEGLKTNLKKNLESVRRQVDGSSALEPVLLMVLDSAVHRHPTG